VRVHVTFVDKFKQKVRGLLRPQAVKITRNNRNRVIAGSFAVLFAAAGVSLLFPSHAATSTVPGQDYMVCDNPGQFLTSPWTYHALASGSQSYTVSQYQALAGYGTTLPPLPGYIAAEGPNATAAVILAPGSSDASIGAYNFPGSPILYFFEGGSYGPIGLQSISGDQFIGGSAPGFPEPQFNNGGGASGINAQNDSYTFSGGTSSLAGAAAAGDTTITVTAALPAWMSYITFSDGTTYKINTYTGTSVTLDSPLSAGQTAGSSVWYNTNPPLDRKSV
jgi:hypothetical protein